MPFWPFKRKQVDELSPQRLQNQLIAAAASGSAERLRKECLKLRQHIADNVGFLCTAPVEIRGNPVALQNYIQHLGAVAQCLAEQCGTPELWNELCGTPETNPLLQWEEWYRALPARMQNLEYDECIAEAQSFIGRARRLEGWPARQHEAMLLGRWGELLFHSGRAADALEPLNAALALCQEIGDVAGQLAYLGNLMEVHRYLGNTQKAIHYEERHRSIAEQHVEEKVATAKLHPLRANEPLCRVVCVQDGVELELEELTPLAEGAYSFEFRRNRPSLLETGVLVQHGAKHASSGELAEALEFFQQAAEVDPHDPDPIYQQGMCYLELGMFLKAQESFEEVERLAPGWFRCRTDRWLAMSLQCGEVSEDEFRLLRLLDDGGLPVEQATAVAQQAVNNYPTFAPFYLVLGDLYRQQGDDDSAITTYRQGLEYAAEPDLESRLLCALAGSLPKESDERLGLVRRALTLKGSLVAQAVARFISVE